MNPKMAHWPCAYRAISSFSSPLLSLSKSYTLLANTIFSNLLQPSPTFSYLIDYHLKRHITMQARCNGCGEIKYDCESAIDRTQEIARSLLLCSECMAEHIEEVAKLEEAKKGK